MLSFGLDSPTSLLLFSALPGRLCLLLNHSLMFEFLQARDRIIALQRVHNCRPDGMQSQ